MTTSTVAPQIAAFARAVRDALADLPDEERDELTEGLEADLSEAYAEDLSNTLPDPVEYAAELRTAAGLPLRTDADPGWARGIADAWASTRRDVVAAIRRNPAAVSVLDFLGSLRPVWWVARAWVATWFLSALFGSEGGFLPTSPSWLVVLAGAVLLSVQWGRGRWGFRALPTLLVLGNAVAAVLVLPAVSMAQSHDADYYADDYQIGYSEGASSRSTEGLSYNGNRLENVYAYDAKGRPLRDVQLFDVDGNPLNAVADGDDPGIQLTPRRLETGAEAYNVFPLELTFMTWDQMGNLVPNDSVDPDKVAAYRDGPFVKVPAVDRSADAEPMEKVSPNNE